MDLIRIDNIDGKLVTTSKNVSEVFGKDHKNILRDIENLDCSEEFRRLNFELSSYKNGQNKSHKMYFITRDGWSFLVMGFTGKTAAKWKEKYISKFNEMETGLKEISASNPPMLPDFNDPVAAARAWADAKESELKAKLELTEAQPKIEFHNQVADAIGKHSMKETAKLLNLGYGRNTLMKKLREMKILMKDNLAYQVYIDAGYFETKENVLGGAEKFVRPQTYTTPKGLIWLQKRFK